MKKVVLIYGLIAGTIVGAIMLITMSMFESGLMDDNNGEIIGYSSMIIALTMVFFGIKSYRDNYLQGSISFWKAAQVGIFIALVAAVMYAGSWEITYARTGEKFMARMGEKYSENMRKEGKPAEEIEKAEVEFKKFIELYKNPFVRFSMTMGEILPVGILITLISAAILRRQVAAAT